MTTTAAVSTNEDTEIAPTAEPAPHTTTPAAVGVVDGVHGLRAHMVPHAAVGALVLAASASRLAVNLTGQEASVATWTAATAFVIAVVAATTARRRIFDQRTLRRVYAFCAVSVVWLTGVTVTGLSMGAVGLLMAIGYAIAAHWFQTHPIGILPATETVTPYEQLWEENIGTTDGCLPGTRLAAAHHIKAGIRYVLRLRPGRQTLEMVHERISKIRGGLFLKRDQDLIIEPHPTLPEPTLLVTIVTRSPIRKFVIHPGVEAFDPATGRIRLGPFADGEGTASWRAYTDNRLWGGFVQGGTGSGKSRLIESIALPLAASHTHPTVIFYGDGQGGASSPLLMKYADLKARTHDEILAMLEGMHLVILLRQDENALSGAEGFTPTDDRPGVLGIIDECHKPLSKVENPENWARIQYLIATIAREGGKVGVALLLASQQTTLDVFGGAGTPHAEAIRTNLLAGNGVMLRSKDPNAKTIFGVDVNPKKFPPLAGYGLLVDPDPEARTAPFRGYYVTDRIRDEWPKTIHWRSLDPGAAAAYGKRYIRRHELADQALEAVRARLAARRAGQMSEPSTVGLPAPAQAGWDGDVLQVYGCRAFPSVTDFAAEVRSSIEAARRRLHEGHDKVLAAIGSGINSPQRIADATDYSVRQVHNLLDELIDVGRVRRSEQRGVYELTPTSKAA